MGTSQCHTGSYGTSWHHATSLLYKTTLIALGLQSTIQDAGPFGTGSRSVQDCLYPITATGLIRSDRVDMFQFHYLSII